MWPEVIDFVNHKSQFKPRQMITVVIIVNTRTIQTHEDLVNARRHAFHLRVKCHALPAYYNVCCLGPRARGQARDVAPHEVLVGAER